MTQSWFRLVLFITVGLAVPVVVLAGAEESRPECPNHNQLVALKSTVWSSLAIPVCWENPSPADEQERGWVRSAVQETWEQHSAIRFMEWRRCSPSNRGIRIGIADVNPHTKGLGSQLDGQREGMMLNFSFEAWSPNCRQKREECIRNVAVHEFGHALGFAHEQNRQDAPDWCKAHKQGTSGDINVTPFDLQSVMNYCNPRWTGDGKLSALDIAGLQTWYAQPNNATARYDGTWQGSLIYSDQTCVTDTVNVTVSGQRVQGRVKTPAGQTVDISATIDADSRLEGFQFRLHPRDSITLRGLLTGGTLHSTDCGCGHYAFTRQ